MTDTAHGPNGAAYGESQPELETALAELRALANNVLLERLQFMRQAGISFGGARDLYEVLGYDRLITTKQYRDEYARGGIAKRIVEAFPKATWRGGVEVYEDDDPDVSTEFEKVWEKHLVKRLNVWSTLLRADILAGLSTYSVILIGAAGDLSTPLPKGRPEGLLYLQPFCGGGGPANNSRQQTTAMDADAMVFEYDTDSNSPRFGEPLSYQLRRVDVASAMLQRPVHWSRIIHVAEGCLDDNVYGQPTLENVWNLLMDLQKVTGGGAEAFWLRANQGLHLDVDKDMSLPDAQNAIASLKEQAELYKHQMTRWLRTRGVSVETIGSDVANFNQPAEAILTQIAGSKGIPMRILTGSERGELASSQDASNFMSQVQDRQTQYAGPMIVRRLASRLIEYGYLPTPKQYEVGWATVETMTEKEKAEGAKQWATTNQAAGEVVYTVSEIREHWHDMEPLTDEQKQEIADEAAEKIKQAQEAMAASQPTVDDPNALLDPDEDEDELRAAGGEGSGVVGHTSGKFPSNQGGGPVPDFKVPAFKGRAHARRAVDAILGGKKARKQFTRGMLKKLNVEDLQRLHAGYGAIGKKGPREFVRAELKLRTAEGDTWTADGLTTGPDAAQEDELVHVLAAALECGATEVVDAIVGVQRSLGAQDGHPFYGNQWTDGSSEGLLGPGARKRSDGGLEWSRRSSPDQEPPAALVETREKLTAAGFIKVDNQAFMQKDKDQYKHPDGRVATFSAFAHGGVVEYSIVIQ